MGIKEQNKSLSDAAGTPKDTSPRRQKAEKESSEVIYNQRSKTQDVENLKSNVLNASTKRSRPSFEGLSYAPSAHIQMNNSGYASPQMQKARYKEKDIPRNDYDLNNFTSSKRSDIINNYTSITQKDSSSDRLNNIIRNNMGFK